MAPVEWGTTRVHETERVDTSLVEQRTWMAAPTLSPSALERTILHAQDPLVFPDEKTLVNRTRALCVAAEHGHEQVVHWLLSTGEVVDERDNKGRTPLLVAAQAGHIAVVELLLRAGAAVDTRDQSGRTALTIAALANNVQLVALLLEYEAATELPDTNGWTPLLAAVYANNVDNVELLLHRNANVDDARAPNGATALIIAAEYGHARVVHVLLEAGARVKAADDEGWTAVMCAASAGRVNIVAMLVTAGANLETLNLGGFSAFSLPWAIVAWTLSSFYWTMEPLVTGTTTRRDPPCSP
ncbi:hypothetical protein PsorP6_006372 [Peronosclerospora sorghi]|uniref:Uncharacterized protein n=1 Tax=Peronosclerospora sorghi TaxID=230839 RepID=A0ACC0W2W0_9STRA|nr:hypothetical protein PsorP6_006372 [Peronosclerospora sorghi]